MMENDWKVMANIFTIFPHCSFLYRRSETNVSFLSPFNATSFVVRLYFVLREMPLSCHIHHFFIIHSRQENFAFLLHSLFPFFHIKHGNTRSKTSLAAWKEGRD
jgi:hypothetical protein